MDESHYEHTLEIKGQQLITRWTKDNQYYYPEFTQVEHHRSLTEAFESLMREDIRLFEKYSEETAEAGKQYTSAQIRNRQSGQPIISITKISFADSPDGEPTAGIYLFTEDREIREIEKKTDYDFYAFQDYDRDSPFLLLARLVYDRSLQVIPDPEWKKLHDNLLHREQTNNFKPKEWKYCICDTNEKLTHAESNHKEVFHFTDPSQAFQFLLHHASDKLKEKQSDDPDEKFTSGLYYRNGQPICQMFRVNVEVMEQFPVDGIYLQINVPTEEFRQLTNIDINTFKTDMPGRFLLFTSTPEQVGQNQPTIAWSRFTKIPPSEESLTRKYPSSIRVILPPPSGGMKL